MKESSLPTLDLKITSLGPKGRGIGVDTSCPDAREGIEVPFTVPGDVVKVSLKRKRRKKRSASLLEVIEPSRDRVVPKCLHFGSCGGCSLQQMAYLAQLEYKEDLVRSVFEKFILSGVPLRPIIASPLEWHYRNKMEYTFSSDVSGNRYLGLIMTESKRHVLNLNECHLVSPWFSELLNGVRAWWGSSELTAYHPYKNEGTLRTLILREGKSSGDRMVMLTVSGNAEYALSRVVLNEFVSIVKKIAEPQGGSGRLSIFLRIQQTMTGMTTNFYEMLLYGPDHIREELIIDLPDGGGKRTLQFQFNPIAFFQPHPLQSAKLYSLALEIAELKSTDVVYDLYCGVGTIGICAGCIAKRVISVDVAPGSVLDARTNVKLNGMNHVTIYAGAIRHVLQRFSQEKDYASPDVVFIDPPRAGLDPLALHLLIELKAMRLVYISCNPVTQGTDVLWLTENGYELELLQPVDQFPQVAHVENIALLVWRGQEGSLDKISKEG